MHSQGYLIKSIRQIYWFSNVDKPVKHWHLINPLPLELAVEIILMYVRHYTNCAANSRPKSCQGLLSKCLQPSTLSTIAYNVILERAIKLIGFFRW